MSIKKIDMIGYNCYRNHPRYARMYKIKDDVLSREFLVLRRIQDPKKSLHDFSWNTWGFLDLNVPHLNTLLENKIIKEQAVIDVKEFDKLLTKEINEIKYKDLYSRLIQTRTGEEYTFMNIKEAFISRLIEFDENNFESKYGKFHEKVESAIKALMEVNVAEWNRIKHELDSVGIRIDLSGVKLSDPWRTSSDWSESTFDVPDHSESYDGADFSNVILVGAKLHFFSTTEKNFTNADLRNVSWI